MRSSAKKKSILDATNQLLVEQGGPQLTMRKVAERAGISLGNLQYHFPNRAILLQALLNDFLIGYEEAMAERSLCPSGNVEKDLEDMFTTVYANPDIDDCIIVFKELWAESQHHPDMKDAMKAYYDRLSSYFSKFIGDVSGLSPDAPEVEQVVSLVVPLLEGYCITGNVSRLTEQQVFRNWAQLVSTLLCRSS